jgi:hypothetical protein
MQILAHSESHIVKLSDGSVGQILSGDIDLTYRRPSCSFLEQRSCRLAWLSQVNCDDGTVVRVRLRATWPEERVKNLP